MGMTSANRANLQTPGCHLTDSIFSYVSLIHLIYSQFYGDIHTDIVYSHTGYDVIIYFRSAANRKNVKILGHIRVAISR